MFVSPALAQAGADSAGPGLLEAFLPIVLIFVVFYFLLIRPQQKKMKQHKEMLANIRRGDRVVTGGGIIGTVVKVVDDELQLEIADGVRVRAQRQLMANVLAKTEPGSAAEPDPTPEPEGGNGETPAPSRARSPRGTRTRRLPASKSE